MRDRFRAPTAPSAQGWQSQTHPTFGSFLLPPGCPGHMCVSCENAFRGTAVGDFTTTSSSRKASQAAGGLGTTLRCPALHSIVGLSRGVKSCKITHLSLWPEVPPSSDPACLGHDCISSIEQSVYTIICMQ